MIKPMRIFLMLSIFLGIGLAIVIVVGLMITSDEHGPLWSVPGGDPEKGKHAILKHGCHACHVISGIREAGGRVGPKLEEIDRQIYVGGVLPNSPNNMIRWILEPSEFSPRTAMPDLELSEKESRDITAYLFQCGEN